jgi:propanediol dehydratase small subunit
MSEVLANPRYPLGESASQVLQAASGRALQDITLEALLKAELSTEDLRIRSETLHAQAAIARQAGYDRLAINLTRAAELAQVPNAELLAMYEALRPGRSTYAALLDLAGRLESAYSATFTGQFVREAAEVYRRRGLLRLEQADSA